MSWIKIQNGIVSNKKIARLAGKMKWNKLQTVGFLVAFWIWAIENCEDGQLHDITDIELAFAVGIDSADGVLRALVESGLADENPLRIHDWPTHQHDFLWGKYKDYPEKKNKILEFYQINSSVTPELLRENSGVIGKERKKERKIDKEISNTETAKAVELVDNAKPVDWSKCNTELQSFMAYYIKEEMPAIYKSGTQAQVSGLFKRFGRPASELLSIAGSLPTAIRVFELSRAFYNKKGLSWNLSTVLANSGDFLNQALQEKQNGNGK